MDENNTKKLTQARLFVPVIKMVLVLVLVIDLWFHTDTQAPFSFIGLEKASVMQVCFLKIKKI
jgi:hypothetical protein